MNFEQIHRLVTADFNATDKLLHHCLQSKVPLIESISSHIIDSGGKRIRQLLVLLCAQALKYSGNDHIKLAVIIELIHTATLLHDDVIDQSNFRRDSTTANMVWGNAASVLTGDFLYSRTFELMIEIDNMDILQVFAGTSNQMAEGEMLQLMNRKCPDTTVKEYLKVIENKTAKLFEAACLTPAILSNKSQETQHELAQFGMNLGNAFQLIDDILDYTASGEQIGKNIGGDLQEGRPTLPLIYAMQHACKSDAQLIAQAIKNADYDQFDTIRRIIKKCGAIEYTQKQASQCAQKAKMRLNTIDNNPAKEALVSLTELSINRSF